MQQEINNAVKILKDGGLILHPTDTFWSIGCNASNPDAVKKVYNLIQIEDCKTLTCLVADDRMLKKHVKQVPFAAQSIIDITNKPTTIIYDAPKNLAANLIAVDNTIGIRIPDNEFCYWLSRRLNGAVGSTPANVSGHPIPKSYKEIAPEVLKGVDYVVNLHRDKICDTSPSVIRLSNSGVVKIIRK